MTDAGKGDTMQKKLSPILLGLALWVVLALVYFVSGLPMWENQSPDGNSYLLGWRTILVLFLLMVATQSVSYVCLRWLHKRRSSSQG
jgi:sterol desaturase/sphingolipid hydroxylase (fatty acid hydroxylase superfamily)